MKGPELRSNARTVLLVVAILGGTALALMHYLSGPVLAGTAGEPTKCVCGDDSTPATRSGASSSIETRAIETLPSVPLAESHDAPSLSTSHS